MLVNAVVTTAGEETVVPLARTKFVPDKELKTPEVFISVPVVNPDKVNAGVVSVPPKVNDDDHAGIVPPIKTCDDVPTANLAGVVPDDE